MKEAENVSKPDGNPQNSAASIPTGAPDDVLTPLAAAGPAKGPQENGTGNDTQADSSNRPQPMPPRTVIRNLPFHQSKNRFAVDHNQGWNMLWLLRHDWFHVFLNIPTPRSLFFLLSVWTGMILLFAFFYMKVDSRVPTVTCGLGVDGNPIEFGPAFAFSLETCTTVGYGLPNSSNSFFENCPGVQLVIYLQMVWSMLFNAFLFAFFYTRLATSDARGVQVLFSKQAVVSVVDGQVRFQFRVYDIDARHPVVEAHVRLYCLTLDRPVQRALRVLQPNDELGSALFLSMPCVVSHHIDRYSLLHPPLDAGLSPLPSGLVLRQVDATTGGRDDFYCPVCAESYGTCDRWVRHVRYQQMLENHDGYPVEGSHLSISEQDLTSPEPENENSIDSLREYFQQHVSEVVCIVEGIDPLTSGNFQALQSYRFQDIVWDPIARLQPCLSVDGGRIQVDINRFHQIARLEDDHEETQERSQQQMAVSATSTTSPTRTAYQRKKQGQKTRSLREHDSFFHWSHGHHGTTPK